MLEGNTEGGTGTSCLEGLVFVFKKFSLVQRKRSQAAGLIEVSLLLL